MSEPPPEVEWHNAPDFAEAAEALGITTRQIFAVQNPESAKPFVLFSLTDDDDDHLLHAVHLRRNVDGTLSADELPRPQPGLWERIIGDAPS